MLVEGGEIVMSERLAVGLVLGTNPGPTVAQEMAPQDLPVALL